MVFVYLTAVVITNLALAYLVPLVGMFWATVIVGSLFVGFDITSRDSLHKRWERNHLWLRMLALIGAGSLLSYVLNRGSGQIALASFAAFLASGVVDAVIYALLHRWSWFKRSNASNVVSAVVDSIVFPTLAFGSLLPLVMLGQAAAKVVGGLAWSLVLRRRA